MKNLSIYSYLARRTMLVQCVCVCLCVYVCLYAMKVTRYYIILQSQSPNYFEWAWRLYITFVKMQLFKIYIYQNIFVIVAEFNPARCLLI